jgi:type IV pilus assembly protein PilM
MPPQQMPSPLKKDISFSSLKLRRPKGMPSLGGGKSSTPSGMSSVLKGGAIRFRRKRTVVVGLDIQPGYVAAAQARVNGRLVVEQAAAVSLPADTVREGEVLNQEALASALRELFTKAGLDKHVRIGAANQRTVMRMLDVPPFAENKDLRSAVYQKAEDQVPMPLASAAVAYRPLGVVDTPEGARQRVVLVASPLEMVQKLLASVKMAGLHVEGIDLSAFALIRSHYRADRDGAEEGTQNSLYLNVGGLTNMAIAEGTNCRFTRVLGRGLEAIAGEVAERRAVPIDQARELLRRVNLSALGSDAHLSFMGDTAAPAPSPEAPAAAPAPEAEGAARVGPPAVEADPSAGLMAAPDPAAQGPEHPAEAPATGIEGSVPEGPPAEQRPTLTVVGGGEGDTGGIAAVPDDVDVHARVQPEAGTEFQPQAGTEFQPDVHPEIAEAPQAAPEVTQVGFGEATPGAEAGDHAATQEAQAQPQAAPVPAQPAPTEDLSDVRLVLEAGVRGIAGEVRNTLDFYGAQEHGGAVAAVYLSGPALDIPGFGEMLEQNLGVPVHAETITPAGADVLGGISAHYMAIAAGLAIEEI